MMVVFRLRWSMLKHANHLAKENSMIFDRGTCSLILLASVVFGSLYMDANKVKQTAT